MKLSLAVCSAWAWTLSWLVAGLTCAAICLAQDEYPLGKPTPAEQRRAATGMLFAMLGGLVVVILLLRWVGKKHQQRLKNKDDETPFDKAQRYFEDQDKGN